MRETGEPWLGPIPMGWAPHRIKSLFEIRKRIAGELGHDVLSVTQKGLRVRDTDSNDGQLSMDYSKYQIVEVGDFVMNHMDLLTGFVDVAATPGVTSPDYRVFVPRSPAELHSPYFLHVFQNAYRQRIFYAFGQGASQLGRWRMPTDNFNSFIVPVPSLPEQTAIAAFLDRETGKIDALVEEQRKLIVLLKEKRQAVISHAVTKGLDPNAKMKPSGVEWLGDVPEHWDVSRLKFLATVQTGTAKGKDMTGRETTMVPYLRVANVQDGYLDLADVALIEIPASDLDRYRLREGDVLMNEGGDFDKLGRGCIWDGQIDPCIHQNHVFAVRPVGVSSEWLNAITGSAYAQFYFMSRSKQSTNLASISSTNVMEMPVVVPPSAEQWAILQYLAKELEKLSTLGEQAAAAIVLLTERRAALISAAVTGKIDVREIVSPPADGAINVNRIRLLVAAEIVDRLSHKKSFGRVKLQKLLYLAEADAGIEELQGQYLREAAGPLDRTLIAEVDAGLQQDQHVTVIQSDGPGSQVVYQLRGERGAYHDELVASIGDRAATLRALVEKLGDLDTKSVEAVTTLYAVWNDALLDHREPTDAMVVSGVLEDWHPEKPRKFKSEELLTWLGWMRRNKLVPRGNGPRTTTGRLFV